MGFYNWIIGNTAVTTEETKSLLHANRPFRGTTDTHLKRKRNICLRVTDSLFQFIFRTPAVDDEEMTTMILPRTDRFKMGEKGIEDSGATTISISTKDIFPRKRAYFTGEVLDTLKRYEENYIEGNDFIEVDTDAHVKERYWQGAFKHIFDTHRPLQGWEFSIFVLACIVATGAVSPSKAFGDRTIDSILRRNDDSPPPTNAQEAVEWIVALSNICTQFSLTTKSFIHVLSRWSRTRGTVNHEYIAELSPAERRILMSVIMTGFASAKMVFDTWNKHYVAPLFASLTLSALTWTSSVAVNLNFTYDRLLTFHDDRFDLAIIRMLTLNMVHVDTLSRDAENTRELIAYLGRGSWYRQLHRVNNTSRGDGSAEQLYKMLGQAESVLRQLILLTPAPTDKDLKLFTKTSLWLMISLEITMCTLLGLIASGMNLKAGLGVPSFITHGYLPNVGVEEYFEKFHEQTFLTTFSLFLGGIVFGLSSFFVNTIINTRACQDLYSSAREALPDFINSGFDNYSRNEQALIFTILLLAGGYTGAKTGQTLYYPLIETPPGPIILAGVTFVVCLGLGIMAMKATAAYGRDRKDNWLLARAISSRSPLITFYDAQTSENRQTLRRLMLNNYSLAMDAFYKYINETRKEIKGNKLVSPELHRLLEEKFGENASVTTTTVSVSPYTLWQRASEGNRGYLRSLFNSPASPPLSPLPLSRQLSTPTSSLSSVIDVPDGGYVSGGTHSPIRGRSPRRPS
jgi:hypothetical protein